MHISSTPGRKAEKFLPWKGGKDAGWANILLSSINLRHKGHTSSCEWLLPVRFFSPPKIVLRRVGANPSWNATKWKKIFQFCLIKISFLRFPCIILKIWVGFQVVSFFFIFVTSCGLTQTQPSHVTWQIPAHNSTLTCLVWFEVLATSTSDFAKPNIELIYHKLSRATMSKPCYSNIPIKKKANQHDKKQPTNETRKEITSTLCSLWRTLSQQPS